MSNKFYNNYRKVRQAVVGQEEDRERSFGEQFFAVFVALLIGTCLIHGFSFLAAIIYPAYHLQILTGSYAIGIFIGVALILTFIETPKYVFFSVTFENYFQSGEKSVGMGFIGFVCVLLSVWSSTNGVPLLVEWWSPKANTKDLELVEEKYDNLENKASAFWQPQIDNATVAANEFFEQHKKWYERENNGEGRWRLPRVKWILNKEKKLSSDLKEAQNSFNSRIAELIDERNMKLQEVKDENKTIVLVHGEKKETATSFAFWVMLALEILYVFGICGIKYYKHRSKQELKGLEESERTETNSTDSNKTNRTTKTEQPENPDEMGGSDTDSTEQERISFKHHGKIIPPDNGTVPKVWYEKQTGGFTKYSASDLRRMAKKPNGTKEWKSELLELANKLDNFKRQKQ